MKKNSGAYRTVLRRVLRDRQRKNSAYSLRAFARDLGISYSYLHNLLDGKRGMSPRAAEKVVKALDLGPSEGTAFCRSVDLEARRKKRALLRRRPADKA